MFFFYKNHFDILKVSFKSDRFILSIFFLICVIAFSTSRPVFLYISNFLKGKLTDSLVSKNLALIIKFLLLLVLVQILIGIMNAIKNYIGKKLHIIIRYNLYQNIGADVLNDKKCEFPCQKMSNELDCFATSFLRLLGHFIESIISFPMFIFILYKISGFYLIILAFLYSLFGHVISGYLAKIVHLASYKVRNLESELRRNLIKESQKDQNIKRTLPNMENVLQETFVLYKTERMLAVFRDTFGNLKSYVPYIALLVPYLRGTITLGDTVVAIGAFRYIMRSIGFFTDHRLTFVQLNVSVDRITELINSKKYDL